MLSNAIDYEVFEPQAIRASLTKPVTIDAQGNLAYRDVRVGFVSTINAAFGSTDIQSFTPATIGGPDIQDVQATKPDTLTNALGKLDGWIAEAFLQQPPAVKPVRQEVTSLYGGIQWKNFTTYMLLDKQVPHVSGIVLILGDPASADYLTLDIQDSAYFPYKAYTDGVSPYNFPLVRLRVFTDFFPFQSSATSYTKQSMTTKQIRLVSESGAAQLPPLGKVIAFEHTDGEDTFTTVNLYLPTIRTAYPVGTELPVRIAYVNKTEGAVHVAELSTLQVSVGAPSAPRAITAMGAAPTSITFSITPPLYSDATGQVAEPYISSYRTHYTLKRMAYAHQDVRGFRYGIPDVDTIPADLASYTTTATHTSAYLPTQSTVLTGLVPGARWSTSVDAYNLVNQVGPAAPGPYVSTLFPAVQTAVNISSASVYTTNADVRPAGSVRMFSYTPADGWKTTLPVTHDIVYVSTVTTLDLALDAPIQWNDVSYPGNRDAIAVATKFTDTNGITQTVDQLAITAVNDVLPAGVPQTAGALQVVLSDTHTLPAHTQYYYKADVTTQHVVDTASPQIRSLVVEQTSQAITGFSDPIITRTMSTPAYRYASEPVSIYATDAIIYTSTCTNLAQVSGLYTPSKDTRFHFDIQGSNFAYTYGSPTVGTGQLWMDQTPVGPKSEYSSFLRIYNGPIEQTTVPFPIDTQLTVSSLTAGFNADVFMDPGNVKSITVQGALNPVDPVSQTQVVDYVLDPTIYIDTVSLNRVSQFSNAAGMYGQRVVSLLPRAGATFTSINDSVAPDGTHGDGLDVSVSAFIQVVANNALQIVPRALYTHTSSISSIYTDYYSRELLFMNGVYMHPAGYDFSVFSPSLLGVSPSKAIYPSFIYDMVYDQNRGFRYASFAYDTSALVAPRPYEYITIRIQKPTPVNVITTARANNGFPQTPVAPPYMTHMRVRLHVKLLGSSTDGAFETEWINGFKLYEPARFDDAVFDTGGLATVTQVGTDVEYTLKINPRYYTKLTAIVRIGISQDGSINGGEPLMFDAVQRPVFS